MTAPASAIKNEVLRLVDAQIIALTQRSSLSTLDLLEYQLRADKLKELYKELDGLKTGTSHGWLAKDFAGRSTGIVQPRPATSVDEEEKGRDAVHCGPH